MHSIIIDQNRRYPLWRANDLYKLLHQAAMASEHAIEDEARARKWLLAEIETMGEGPDEPVVDPIAPDGLIVRVHLRPFIEENIDPEELLESFIATADRITPSEVMFQKSAQTALNLARNRKLPFQPEALQRLFDEMAGLGFPAIHHSADYESAYKPAYRVIARQLLPEGMKEYLDI
jgi:hypothetical protein